MAPRPTGEESEALNRAAFVSLGQKRRAFEPLCLSLQTVFSPPSLGINFFLLTERFLVDLQF
jgi:hypothetical protein